MPRDALTALLAAPMWAEHETAIDLYPGSAQIEDTPAVFGVTTECVDADAGGWETRARAELLTLALGGLQLSRAQVVQMLTEPGRDGEALVRQIERDKAMEYLTVEGL